jgi:hypothetical protein
VAGLIPWWITGWRIGQRVPHWTAERIIGMLVLAAGIAVLVQAFARFVAEGGGTPAPVAPTEQLVIGGLYRYVRNQNTGLSRARHWPCAGQAGAPQREAEQGSLPAVLSDRTPLGPRRRSQSRCR